MLILLLLPHYSVFSTLYLEHAFPGDYIKFIVSSSVCDFYSPLFNGVGELVHDSTMCVSVLIIIILVLLVMPWSLQIHVTLAIGVWSIVNLLISLLQLPLFEKNSPNYLESSRCVRNGMFSCDRFTIIILVFDLLILRPTSPRFRSLLLASHWLLLQCFQLMLYFVSADIFCSIPNNSFVDYPFPVQIEYGW